MKARLYIDVEFNGRKIDTESVAAAMDNVVKAGMSALGDCWDEYGGAPKVEQFLVLDTCNAQADYENVKDQIELLMHKTRRHKP